MAVDVPDNATTFQDTQGQTRTGDDGLTGTNKVRNAFLELWKFVSGDDTTAISSHALPDITNEYTVATVPTAASNTGRVIMVTDETGGYVPAFSDGTNWRRVTDRAIVS